MKRLLVDENLPAALSNALSSTRIEVIHVSSVGLIGASDRTIWARALHLDAAIATKDADFVDLASIQGKGQVVLFKVGNMRIGDVVRFAAIHSSNIAEFLESGDQVLILIP